ncbi:MAG: hypothetical protein ACLR3S_02320 [Clostridium fessum]
MNQTLNGIRRILITILVAMGVGALFIIAIGENPIDAYAALFRGAFDGKLVWAQPWQDLLRCC